MIAPNTDVYLLNTVLHNDGVNTLTWSSETLQRNYFTGCRVFTLTDYYYQRANNAIKVELPIDTLYGNVNYVMYRNTSYTDKWFYAFIDNLEYVNDNTTLIYLRTDEFQTWYFDINFKSSFVVREHTNDDTVGNNRTDEGLGLGNYVCEKKETMWSRNALPRIAMLAPLNVNTIQDVSATGVYVASYVPSTWVSINYTQLYRQTGRNGYYIFQCMNQVSAQDESITRLVYNLYLVPEADARNLTLERTHFIQTWGEIENNLTYGITINSLPSPNSELRYSFELTGQQSGGTVVTQSYASYMSHNIMGYNFQMGDLQLAVVQGWLDKLNSESLSDDVGALYLIPPSDCGTPVTDSNGIVTKNNKTFTLTRTVDGYVPKNNKLLCYPYTIVKLHNASDGRRVLAPELFYSYGTCGFEYWSSFEPGCTVIAVPLSYRGVRESLEYAINSRKYPLSAARFNGFQNWMGIHATERNISIISGIRNVRMNALPFFTGGVGINNSDYISESPLSYLYGNMTFRERNVPQSGYGVSARDYASTYSRYKAGKGLVKSRFELAQFLAEDNARQKEAFQTIGSIDNNNLNAVNNINIFIEQQTITYDYAKRIDDYFSMYGYKTNQLKVPNITGRRNWNFVQVSNANIIGAIPNDSMDNIRRMLESGVTFWHNPNTYMDYSQDNSII